MWSRRMTLKHNFQFIDLFVFDVFNLKFDERGQSLIEHSDLKTAVSKRSFSNWSGF